MKKYFIRLYIKLYIRGNQDSKTNKKLGKKLLLVDNSFLKSKNKYQLVVKLKINKCYKELLYYLTFYIGF